MTILSASFLDQFMLGVKHSFITVYGDMVLNYISTPQLINFLVIGPFFPLSNTKIANVSISLHAS